MSPFDPTDMDAPVTRRDFHDGLARLLAETERRADVREQRLLAQVGTEVARQVRAANEEMRAWMAAAREEMRSWMAAANQEMRTWMTERDERIAPLLTLPAAVQALDARVTALEVAPRRNRRRKA